MKLLSIAIVNYNFGRFLGEAIESVLRQCVEWPSIVKALESGVGGVSSLTLATGDEIEIVICDAASRDDSVALIEEYARVLSGVRFTEFDERNDDACFLWCSEKDRGQSHAFNKAYRRANGRFLTWLNADDILLAGSLADFAHASRRHPKCEWFTGNFIRFNETSKRIFQVNIGPNYFPLVLQTRNMPIMVYGPSTMFSKKIYEMVGGIGEDYHYCMDSDLWVKFIVRGVHHRRVRNFWWAFRVHEDSKTSAGTISPAAAKIGGALHAEHERTRVRESYSASELIRRLVGMWRFFDGSWIRLIFLRLCWQGKKYMEV